MPVNKISLFTLRAVLISLVSFLFFTVSAAEAVATKPMDQIRKEALDSILPHYSDWGSAELSGKLRLAKLPLSPTLRIYMKKGEQISISVRAPFIGEAGRIEIDKDSILAVNRMKRVYCAESIAGIQYDYPDIISDVQALLLGRVVVMNAGQLSARNADFLDFSEVAADGSEVSETFAAKAWNLDFPKGRSEADEFGYTYRINGAGLVESLRLFLESRDLALSLDYQYPDKSRVLDISLEADGARKFSAEVEFNPVKWGATPPAPVKIDSRYRQVDIRAFIKSF